MLVMTKFSLYSINNGQTEPVEADSLTRELLETNNSFILDCGIEVFVWMGRNTSLDDRKTASKAAEVTPLIFLKHLGCLKSSHNSLCLEKSSLKKDHIFFMLRKNINSSL